MPADPLIDVEALLEPIPGDDPAGVPVPFMLRQQFEDLRKSVDPDDYDADDPQRPEAAKEADWPAIIRLARETLAELTPWVLKQGLELDLEAGEGDFRVRGDAGSLGIALQNLVTNAVNFSPAGGRVRVLLQGDAQRVLLRVEDQGPGIAAEDLPHVFDRFSQADGQKRRSGSSSSTMLPSIELRRS